MILVKRQNHNALEPSGKPEGFFLVVALGCRRQMTENGLVDFRPEAEQMNDHHNYHQMSETDRAPFDHTAAVMLSTMHWLFSFKTCQPTISV